MKYYSIKLGNVLIPEGPPVMPSTHAGGEEWGAKEGSQRAARPCPFPLSSEAGRKETPSSAAGSCNARITLAGRINQGTDLAFGNCK